MIIDSVLRELKRAANPPIAREMPVAFSDTASLRARRAFARLVCAARALLGWSQSDLAHRASLNLRTVQRLEKAREMPAESTFVGVCAALAAAGIKFISDGRNGIGMLLMR